MFNKYIVVLCHGAEPVHIFVNLKLIVEKVHYF